VFDMVFREALAATFAASFAARLVKFATIDASSLLKQRLRAPQSLSHWTLLCWRDLNDLPSGLQPLLPQLHTSMRLYWPGPYWKNRQSLPEIVHGQAPWQC